MNDDEQMRTNIHALGGILTYSLIAQVNKAFASDCVATGSSHLPYVLTEGTFILR
jgi:hypothetical protein